jgi:general nucleoside transport system ATP-binding protein
VFISHKLHEVVDLADRIGILRRGRLVADLPAEGLDPAAIAALMVGATAAAEVEDEALATAVGLDVAPEPVASAPVVDRSRPAALEVHGLTLAGDPRPRVDDVSLTVRAGEIVGVAGVSGNGQTELVALLCGTTPVTAGTVHVGGSDVTRLDVAARLRAGLGRLTEDRRGSVVLGMSVEQNLVLEDLDRFRTGPFLSRRRVRAHAESLIERFDIRAAAADPIRSLSGGNMQKVLLARAIERDPTVLVASQPTRGLDVGACEYVYAQLRALREAGSGVLLVSEDLDELIGIADRIVVLSGGRLVGEVAAADATREALGVLMTGGPREHAA